MSLMKQSQKISTPPPGFLTKKMVVGQAPALQGLLLEEMIQLWENFLGLSYLVRDFLLGELIGNAEEALSTDGTF